jgi:hypothetical protein
MNGSPRVLGVLIIDDNGEWARLVRMRIERSLPESQRVVRWEATLAQGIAALADFHADSIILDLSVTDSEDPNETAKSIPRLLSGTELNPWHPPITVMSNHFDQSNPWNNDLVMRCMEAGAFTVYPKDEVAVAAVVREIVFTHVRNTIRASKK